MPGNTGTKRPATDRTDLLKAYKLDQYDHAIFAVLKTYAHEQKASSDYYLHISNGFLDRTIIIPPKEGTQRERLKFANKIKDKLNDPKGIFFLTKRSEHSISIKGEDDPERKVGNRRAKLFRLTDVDGALAISGETVSTVLQRYALYNEIVLKVKEPRGQEIQEIDEGGLKFSFSANPVPLTTVPAASESGEPQKNQESDEDSEIKAYRKQHQEKLAKETELAKTVERLKKKKTTLVALSAETKPVDDNVQRLESEAEKLKADIEAIRKQGFFVGHRLKPAEVANDTSSSVSQPGGPGN